MITPDTLPSLTTQVDKMDTTTPIYHTGKISLHRQQSDFTAAFCLLKGELPALTTQLHLLHPIEREYYDQLKFDRRKTSYLLGRIAAKKAVSCLAGIDTTSFYIGFGVFEFPVVKSAAAHNLQVTLSHCDDIGIALAFPEEHPLGLDIEGINNDRIDTLKSQMTAGETGLIQTLDLPAPAGYTLAWTAKEALSKIFRTGLMMDFNLLEIKSTERTGTIYTSTFRHCHQYKALSCPAGNYVCTLVLPAKTNASPDELWRLFTSIASR